MHQTRVLQFGKLKGNRAEAGDYILCDQVSVSPADHSQISDYCLFPHHFIYPLTRKNWGLAGLIRLK